jgi:hypothetical protein
MGKGENFGVRVLFFPRTSLGIVVGQSIDDEYVGAVQMGESHCDAFWGEAKRSHYTAALVNHCG